MQFNKHEKMDILEAFMQKSREDFQKQLDAIDDNQFSCKTKKRSKLVEKLHIFQQWNEMLNYVSKKVGEEIDKIKEMVNELRVKIRNQGEDLQRIRENFDRLHEELNNDDSGIGEFLSTAQLDYNQTDLENRQADLVEAINDLSTEMDQLSVEMTAIDRTQSRLSAQYAEVREKFDQLGAEIQQELDTDN